jgi:hypothetical protein
MIRTAAMTTTLAALAVVAAVIIFNEILTHGQNVDDANPVSKIQVDVRQGGCCGTISLSEIPFGSFLTVRQVTVMGSQSSVSLVEIGWDVRFGFWDVWQLIQQNTLRCFSVNYGSNADRDFLQEILIPTEGYKSSLSSTLN